MEVEIFPIKDSYISFFRRDMSSIEKNPKTVQRVADILLSIPYDKIVERCKTPKESNRQIGPMFKKWVNKVDLGLPVYKDVEKFSHIKSNGILNTSDEQMLIFAKEYLQYNRKKGIDFIARKNGEYIIGEAKFLTDFGGHQNAQLDVALKLTESFANISKNMKIIPIVIADGVIYINNDGKMYDLLKNGDDKIILSSLLLKDFIKSI